MIINKDDIVSGTVVWYQELGKAERKILVALAWNYGTHNYIDGRDLTSPRKPKVTLRLDFVKGIAYRPMK